MLACVRGALILTIKPLWYSGLTGGFRIFKGISDDGMRETAYEVLLASVVHSGGQKPCFEEKKKERKSKFLKGLRSRRDGSQFQLDESRSDLMDTIRAQLEISEAMDTWTKKGLQNFCLRSMPNRADVPQIFLELLGTLSISDFPNERFYNQWLRRHVDILEELLTDPTNSVASEQQMLSYLLSNIRNGYICLMRCALIL